MADKTQNYNLTKPTANEFFNIENQNENMDLIDAALANIARFEKAGGTATQITLTGTTLQDGISKTFIAKYTDTDESKTINGKSWYMYKGTITSPSTAEGNAYTVWYDEAEDCFFTQVNESCGGGSNDIDTATGKELNLKAEDSMVEITKIEGNYKQKVVNPGSKNFFDISRVEQGGLNASGAPVASTTAWRTKLFLMTMAPGNACNYIFSGLDTSVIVFEYSQAKAFIKSTVVNNNTKFTTQSTAWYIKIHKDTTPFPQITQMEAGSIVNPFEEFNPPTPTHDYPSPIIVPSNIDIVASNTDNSRNNKVTITQELAALPSGICDTIEIGVDGKLKHIKRIGKLVLNGSEANWSKSSITTVDRFILSNISTELQPVTDGLCTIASYDYFNSPFNEYFPDTFQFDNSAGFRLLINYSVYGVTTLDQFKAELAAKPVTVYYLLATPVETVLNNIYLTSYYPVTSVYSTASPQQVNIMAVTKSQFWKDHFYINESVIKDIDTLKSEISDVKSYVGYTDPDIVGLEVDFRNKTFARLAGAVNKTAGSDFDYLKAFGGRRRCIVADSGVVLAYYGEAAYTETGSLLQAVTVGGTTYAIGTKVQVMVEQPKFYYKVVPLSLEKIEVKEINDITIRTGASASGNITINLDGKGFTIPVSAGDDDITVATKIRAASYSGWTTGGSAIFITFTSNTSGTKVTATLAAASTGVTATVTKAQAGYIGKGFHMRKARYYVSDTMKIGFNLHPAFISNGVKKNFIYLSAYEGSLYDVSASAYILNDSQVADFAASTGDKLCSIANAKPISGSTQNLTRANTRALARNRGTGWQQAYAASIAATQMLFMIEYASFNSQSKIGRGNVDKSGKDDGINYAELTGATTNLGNISGAPTNINGVNIVTYRGEENIWGNIRKWVDGLNIYSYGEQNLYVADNSFADNINTSPYKDAGFTLVKGSVYNGYISAFGYSEDFDWLFLPSETLGDTSLPVGDSHSQNSQASSWCVARLGGAWSSTSGAGAFNWDVDFISSDRNCLTGGRLVYIPATVG